MLTNLLAATITSCSSVNGFESCTTNNNASGGGILALGLGLWVLFFVIYILVVVIQWKIFVKAGKAGWASLIPIYNTVTLLSIVGKPDWWVILFLIPFVNIVIGFIVAVELAKSFGKSVGFAIGALILLPFIGYPMLAFGKASYVGVGGIGAEPQVGPSLAPTTNAPPANAAPASTIPPVGGAQQPSVEERPTPQPPQPPIQ